MTSCRNDTGFRLNRFTGSGSFDMELFFRTCAIADGVVESYQIDRDFDLLAASFDVLGHMVDL